ncbi:hypothetical protein [Pseudobutyrivibrio sp. MD2005]|uniref:hypothetical protein n=1 Tax=Pseudobutyrivibrio sp. MD2005 TaxID=1410616 RepID=UPI0004840BBD|nr:hypothetical protein [Pseudobutyrivibrio sp. MD2005]
MEKMEYRTRIEEMKNLVSKNKFADAMNVADTINWRKVHNINDLIAGSESYETCGKIEEARDLLLIAHERSPIGRMILYKLCMISIKLRDIDEAQEYYNEFVQIAPHDSLRYILKYNINVAKGADNATLIKILEQLKESDFIEEWAYELAYLYHKTNQGDKCIALCDEIILWFGDGPVVERALELKMLYQPLDKSQEDKYRNFQQKKDGITEISPQIIAESSSVVPNIKQIQLPEGPERFDTINLQAEIKKNIDEIMKATDTGEVSENIDAIKNLVEEIPYLQVPEEPIEEETEEFSINDTFQQYLEEGFDGQISLRLTDDSTETEEQIEGQMTIEDVLAEWEKTKRAAEAAMEDAKSKELESARAKALREANSVLNRLEGAMSKLDAGVSPQDLLKEEYLSNESTADAAAPVEAIESTETEEIVLPELPEEPEEIASEEVAIEEDIPEEEIETSDIPKDEEIADLEEKATEHTGFAIPKLSTDGMQQGLVDIPVVSAAEAAAAGAEIAAAGALMHGAGVSLGDTTSWEPPVLESEEDQDEVDYTEASQMIADMNSLLQKEIDRLTVPKKEDEPELPTIQMPEGLNEEFVEDSSEDVSEDIDEAPQSQQTIDDDFELPPIIIPEDILKEMSGTSSFDAEEIPVEELEAPVQEEYVEPEQYAEPYIPEVSVEEPIPQQVEIEQEPVQQVMPEVKPYVPESNHEAFTYRETTVVDLEEEDLDIFSYFLPIDGMKESIVRAIAGTAEHLRHPGDNGGSIVIVGEPGSGKTQMATSIIKVLQKKVGYPKGGIGKISGEKLNEKDIQKLYAKIQGGCLIIESAGGISKETAVTLSLLMETDDSGTIIIIEDNKKGIDKALMRDGSFAKRFTEKIVIPVFSIDELVSFAKTYALEAGCTIDDMGILALYNRINLIGRYDHVTTVKEVAEIMDDAIEKSTKGGFFNKPKYDKNGNVILKEKDFDK